ncbi:MAG: ABC transporter ATP-binding protein [Firmicutes bacterium]|nr:ABC transporter ATP-binding protein [Bacillota bacterium]
MPTVVDMAEVTKSFKGRPAVDKVTIRIESGSVVSLLGPNGAGKTTTIAMMLGLIQPSRGKVALFGGDPALARHHERLGVMLQGVSVPDRLTVVETINLFRGLFRNPSPTERLLAAGDLVSEAKTMANKLSGGKMRRLQFALALAGNPDVLFLDEPTVGMDVAARRHFWDELRTFVGAGKTLLLTTHDMQEVDLLSDRVIVLHRGKVLLDTTPESMKLEFSGRQVSFAPGPRFDRERAQRAPEVTSIAQTGRRIVLRTNDSDTLLRRLVKDSWDVSEIEVSGGGLEDAFVHLTQPEGVGV